MWIEIGNAYSKLVRYTEAEVAWLDHYIGVPDSTARFRGGGADARRPLLNPVDLTFPSGLLPLVRRDARAKGFEVQEHDLRKPPCKPDVNVRLDWLRPYQEEAVDQGIVKSRGVFECSTGMGKTECFVALSALYRCNWAVFVNGNSLISQTQKRFNTRTGEEVGVIGDSEFNPKRVTVATVQSVYSGLRRRSERMRKWLSSVQGLHFDEVHGVASDTAYAVVMAAHNAFFRFGYSATPYARGDKKGLLVVAAIGPTIFKMEPDELIELGAVAKPRVRMYPFVHAPVLVPIDYSTVYTERIAMNQRRNKLVCDIVKKCTRPALVFVKEIHHGQRELSPMFTNANIANEFVWGEKKVQQRDAAVRRLEHGDVDVLIANVVFQAGKDIPCLRTIVNAASGKATIPVVQQTGRGMRRHDAQGNVVKDEFDVIDIDDRDCGCAFKATDGRTYYRHKSCEWMVRHSRARRAAYINAGYELVVETGPP